MTNSKYSRRDVLTSGGTAMTLGLLASAFGATLPRGARAADSAHGVHCLTILYPAGDGIHFNADYYRDHHLTLIMKLYTNTISRFELRKGDKNMAGAKPDFIGTVNIYIADAKAFEEAGKQHGQTLRDDVPHFSSVMPTAFPTVIHGAA
jgi:uncharacterized protein (TIGR02118 family)